ncbi:mesotocin receptor-like isoform X2 [Convolutriloba macropyga]|uniref:mesotocin receptor-like isoform X2 n=1 Tax=Convolutriloba macropyga TaxID=536237 RepID=UPI003F527D13
MQILEDVNATWDLIVETTMDSSDGTGGGGMQPVNPYLSAINASRISLLVIGIMGLIGNTLTYKVSSMINDSGDSSGTVFMKCLALADNMAVLRITLDQGLPVFGITIRTLNNMACKIIGFFSGAGTITSNYILIALSFDRVLALWMPVFYYRTVKAHHALITCVSVLVSSLVINSHLFYYFELNPVGVCRFDVSKDYTDLRTAVYTFTLTLVVPVVSVVASNVAIVWKLRRNQKESTVAKDSNQKKDREITISLIFLSVLFILNMIAFAAWSAHRISGHQVKRTLFSFLIVVKDTPLLLNNSMNFFLYFLASQSFKNSVLVLLGIAKKTPQKGGSKRPPTGRR